MVKPSFTGRIWEAVGLLQIMLLMQIFSGRQSENADIKHGLFTSPPALITNWAPKSGIPLLLVVGDAPERRLLVLRSTDGGATVTSLPQVDLGIPSGFARTSIQGAVEGNNVVLAAIAQGQKSDTNALLNACCSIDSASSWSSAVRLSSKVCPGTIARVRSLAPQQFIVVWQEVSDVDRKPGTIMCARTLDAGKTWDQPIAVTDITSLTTCTKCPVSVATTRNGKVGIMFRGIVEGQEKTLFSEAKAGSFRFQAPREIPGAPEVRSSCAGSTGSLDFQDDFDTSPPSDRWPLHAFEKGHSVYFYHRGGIKVTDGTETRFDYPSSLCKFDDGRDPHVVFRDGTNVLAFIDKDGHVRMSMYSGDGPIFDYAGPDFSDLLPAVCVDAAPSGYVGVCTMVTQRIAGGFSVSLIRIPSLSAAKWTLHN